MAAEELHLDPNRFAGPGRVKILVKDGVPEESEAARELLEKKNAELKNAPAAKPEPAKPLCACGKALRHAGFCQAAADALKARQTSERKQENHERAVNARAAGVAKSRGKVEETKAPMGVTNFETTPMPVTVVETPATPRGETIAALDALESSLKQRISDLQNDLNSVRATKRLLGQ
jgi:hypothetical protein